MKTQNFLILLIIFITIIGQTVRAQPTEIHLDEISPRWFFVNQDTNFFSGNSATLNSYTSQSIGFNPTINDDYVFALFPGIRYNGGYDGLAYHKIRLEDGEVLWSKHMNTSNGDFQFLAGHDFLLPDNKIAIVGKKRTNLSQMSTILDWRIGGFSQPFVRIINGTDGNILLDYFNQNDSVGKNDLLNGDKYQYLNNFNILLKTSYGGNGLNFERFNYDTKEFDFLQKLFYYFEMPVNEVDGILDASQYKLSENKIAMLYSPRHSTRLLENSESYVDYYEFKDSFSLIRRKPIIEYFKKRLPGGLSDFVLPIVSKNGEFLIYKAFEHEGAGTKWRFWMLWLDENGEEKVYIPDFKIDSIEHVYEVPIPFYVGESGAYFYAAPSYTGKNGGDIVRIKPNGEIQIVGSLTTGNTRRMSGIRLSMNDSGDLVLMTKWDTLYTTVMGFHISDFGINLSSEDENFVDPTPLLTVSPNPASDDISLYITDEKYRQGIVQIYNLTGQTMLQQIISHGETLNVRDLAAGSYIVQFSPDSRPGYFLTTKLVKE